MKKFSFGWAYLGAFIHIIVTIFVGLCAVSSAMGASPTYNPTRGLQATELMFWILNTGPMIAYKYFGMTFAKGLYLVVLLWSVLFGIATGFCIPMLKRIKSEPNF
jgi:hypothetical protein